ncbi:DUF6493 family protein [Nonomuraea sp. NPDC047897]|uniref:DUF6493 family protein n=1 Tax=Nonomuraea sp. NPDC047897 TaxID=3364346 RepID=UPI0037178EC3
MNPWREVLDRIEAGDNAGLVEFLDGLGDVGRHAVAVQLPGHLSERLAAGWQARWELRDEAAGYRLAGAACLGGAAQVATWLNRRELRDAAGRTDAERILRLLRRRPEGWRRDLAVRLVERLRLPRGRAGWRWTGGMPGWHLAAGLILQTGAEPPANDAFTAGWVLRMAAEREVPRPDDPLLDLMVARLFHAAGVAAGLTWSQVRESRTRDSGHDIVTALVTMSGDGRLKRQDLLDGCLTRFLSGAAADELAPFVAMWRQLAPEAAEIPALEFTRLLPSAPPVLAQLALDELRRADRAGLLDGELFGEAVQALAYRPERKHVTAALKWIADTASRVRSGDALIALATAFSHEAPAVRDRAVRLALNLGTRHAPGIASDDPLVPGWEAVREAAATLPGDLRERVAAVFGEVAAPADEQPAAPPAPVARPLPALPPPIETPDQLADELSRPAWPEEPAVLEGVLAALVALTHRDREAVLEALRPWWRTAWPQPFDAHRYVHGWGYDRAVRSLLHRCALAVVSPADSRALTVSLDAYTRPHPVQDPPLHQFVQRRFREVIDLFERGGTVPVLLATPTSPTGHVDPETLLERLELLDGAEPLPADLDQALLRLPRLVAGPHDPAAPGDPLPWVPALAVRAEEIGTEAGRRLAAWLRAGGLPHPAVWCTRKSVSTVYGKTSTWNTRIIPAAVVPDAIAGLLATGRSTGYPDDTAWWPWTMPSHREVVAAHLLPVAAAYGEPGPADALAALAHGDGPLGEATATALTMVMGHRRPERRAAATDAIVTLAGRGDLPGFGGVLGNVVGRAVRAGLVKLNRVNTVLQEATEAGAGTWPVLAAALEVLLPEPGSKAPAGLGELLATAVRSAVLAGARGDVPGLAALAARKGASRTGEEARRLHHHLTGA